MFSPVELEIELFCRGMLIDSSCLLGEEARRIARTRAGLGSGLEIVIPGAQKKIWANIPVNEPFVQKSPFTLLKTATEYSIVDRRDGASYHIDIPEEPEWYSRRTTAGTEMSRVGVLQGNYLGIFLTNNCLYWQSTPSLACKFCTTGKNVGVAEESGKKIEDVVEVAKAARDESGSIFTHFNTGYHFEDDDRREKIHGIRQCEPFVRAVRKHVGGFIGVQAVPVPRHRFADYDRLIDAGVDHLSFCYEFEDPEVFAKLCPGKAQTVGQNAFFEAMEYTAKKLGPGRVSGEIIAGVESLEWTKRGIDRIVNAGAFPTVCIFRPTVDSEMENTPSPEPDAMKEVFAYAWNACRRVGLPIGVLPIEVSLVVQPEEGRGLVEPTLGGRIYGLKLAVLKQLAKPYIAWKLRPHPAS